MASASQSAAVVSLCDGNGRRRRQKLSAEHGRPSVSKDGARSWCQRPVCGRLVREYGEAGKWQKLAASASKCLRGSTSTTKTDESTRLPAVTRAGRPRVTRLTRGRPINSQLNIRAGSADSSTATQVPIGIELSIPQFEVGDLDRPAWAGEQRFAKAVNAVLSVKPVFNVIREAARMTLINNAEKTGIPWREIVSDLANSTIYEEKELLEDKSIKYPEYFKLPFHGYPEGLLSWQATFEYEPARQVISQRTFKPANWDLTPQQASQLMGDYWMLATKQHINRHASIAGVKDILDIGCASGRSTEDLADTFPDAQVTGLDGSSHFLALARYRQKQAEEAGNVRKNPIRWIHALMENNHFPDNSFDLVGVSFVFHEIPPQDARLLLREVRRLLRPGGTLSILEITPKSKTLQSIPNLVAIMMKSTEPYLDDFLMMDLKKEIREAGFTHVVDILTDPRHATTTATAL